MQKLFLKSVTPNFYIELYTHASCIHTLLVEEVVWWEGQLVLEEWPEAV